MVIFAVAEETYDTILKPRLLAAGANLEHIRVLDWRRAGSKDAVRIPDDIPVLERHLAEMNALMLIIDPLLSHLTGKTNSHIDHEVKLALRPLIDLAHNTGCAVLGNGHFGKDKSGGARRANMGSTAFTSTPRVGLAMAYDDKDSDVRVLEVVKSNIGPKGIGRNYRVRAVPVDGLNEPVPMLVAEGTATKAVDDLITSTSHGKRIPSQLGTLRAIYGAGDEAGLNPEGVEKVGCHDLRHSCAGLLFAAGMTAPTVAAVLRHADTRTTLTTYAGLVETNRPELRRGLDAAFGNGGTT
jgi:hypothetical protein